MQRLTSVGCHFSKIDDRPGNGRKEEGGREGCRGRRRMKASQTEEGCRSKRWQCWFRAVGSGFSCEEHKMNREKGREKSERERKRYLSKTAFNTCTFITTYTSIINILELIPVSRYPKGSLRTYRSICSHGKTVAE